MPQYRFPLFCAYANLMCLKRNGNRSQKFLIRGALRQYNAMNTTTMFLCGFNLLNPTGNVLHQQV
jgi:hypothetical protein